MNNVDLDSKNIVNKVGSFNDIVAINANCKESCCDEQCFYEYS